MPIRRTFAQVAPLIAAIPLALAMGLTALAQSQESKPTLPATPIAEPDVPTIAPPESGVSGTTWAGPSWGVSVAWDPAIWSVENEQIAAEYDGLQLGTPDSTVFIEAYEGFAGDADACLADAEREIRERQSASEVTPLAGRPLPEVGTERGPAQLFGIIATLPEGGNYRGVEYVECRTIVPGTAVLELTWQTSTARFNDQLPLVSAVFTTIDHSADNPESVLPELPSTPPVSEPNTARSTGAVAA